MKKNEVTHELLSNTHIPFGDTLVMNHTSTVRRSFLSKCILHIVGTILKHNNITCQTNETYFIRFQT